MYDTFKNYYDIFILHGPTTTWL